MPRESLDADDPRRWMAFAQSDFNLAKKGRFGGVRMESLCYLAQQAAEKSIKAVLMHKKIHVPNRLLETKIGLPSSLSTPKIPQEFGGSIECF